MNHKEKLLQAYEKSTNVEDIKDVIPVTQQEFITQIAKNCYQSKAVYTVLITLLVHKTLNPEQDIRFHQAQIARSTRILYFLGEHGGVPTLSCGKTAY